MTNKQILDNYSNLQQIIQHPERQYPGLISYAILMNFKVLQQAIDKINFHDDKEEEEDMLEREQYIEKDLIYVDLRNFAKMRISLKDMFALLFMIVKTVES